MDVDFSQVGQNVALKSLVQDVRPSVVDKTSSVEEKNQQQKVENVQASSAVADSNATVSNVSTTIESAVAEVSDFVQARNRLLAFSIDEDSNRSVVKVTDSESGDVIRQIPSEEVLALSERIKELQTDVGAAVGVLFNKQA